jgi:hypothetical protein
VAGKIIADIIEAPYDSIRMNVGNVTVLTANNSGLTYTPTGNVNVNIGTTASLTLGNVTVSNLITASGGIKFPATQVASGDANTLDDYEEGTWTPTTNQTAGTYTAQHGYYTKIGRFVHVSARVDATGASFSAAPIVNNLPFTVINSQARSPATVSAIGGITFSDYLTGEPYLTTTNMFFEKHTSGGARVDCASGDFASSYGFFFSAVYAVA